MKLVRSDRPTRRWATTIARIGDRGAPADPDSHRRRDGPARSDRLSPNGVRRASFALRAPRFSLEMRHEPIRRSERIPRSRPSCPSRFVPTFRPRHSSTTAKALKTTAFREIGRRRDEFGGGGDCPFGGATVWHWTLGCRYFDRLMTGRRQSYSDAASISAHTIETRSRSDAALPGRRRIAEEGDRIRGMDRYPTALRRRSSSRSMIGVGAPTKISGRP